MSVFHESAPAPVMTGPLKARVKIIEGDRWGSSGYYPSEVLERDGPTCWPIGTHVFIDHPSASEKHDRPERSVKDLAGKLITTPVYEAGALWADVEFNALYAPLVRALHDTVGMSIRASGETVLGERDGRTGPIVQTLTDGVSVDVVTRPGAGGAIVQLLESFRTNQGDNMSETIQGGSTAVKPVVESAEAFPADTAPGDAEKAVTRAEFDALVKRVDELEKGKAAEAQPTEAEKPAVAESAAPAVDTAAIAEAVAKQLAESYAITASDSGAGIPRGNGTTPLNESKTITDADVLAALRGH